MSEAIEEVPSLAAPGWVLLSELACVMLLGAHCLAGARDTIVDSTLFALGGLFVFGLRKYLPAPPPVRSAKGELGLLAGFTLVGVSVAVLFGIGQGASPSGYVVSRTLVVYVGYAFLQQYLTQRYLVVRLNHWLGWSSPLRVAFVVGLLFALLHLPFPGLMLPTALAGFVWSAYYLTSGRLLPIAVSHALLGSSFILFVLDRDPFANDVFAWVR